MKVSGLVVILAFLLACNFATLASAKSKKGSCSGVSPTTIKQAQAATFAAGCAEGRICATTPAACSKAALEANLKANFMSLMTTFNIGPFCAGAIVASVAQSKSPLACP